MAKKVAIIGAGPAGLTAAYLLGKAAQDVTVFEKDPQYVGVFQEPNLIKGIILILADTVSFQSLKKWKIFGQKY